MCAGNDRRSCSNEPYNISWAASTARPDCSTRWAAATPSSCGAPRRVLLGRGRQSLHRLLGRVRRAHSRPRPSRRHRGGGQSGRARHRVRHPPRAGNHLRGTFESRHPVAGESPAGQHGHRSGHVRHAAGPRRDGAQQDRQVFRLLPRPLGSDVAGRRLGTVHHRDPGQRRRAPRRGQRHHHLALQRRGSGAAVRPRRGQIQRRRRRASRHRRASSGTYRRQLRHRGAGAGLFGSRARSGPHAGRADDLR